MFIKIERVCVHARAARCTSRCACRAVAVSFVSVLASLPFCSAILTSSVGPWAKSSDASSSSTLDSASITFTSSEGFGSLARARGAENF